MSGQSHESFPIKQRFIDKIDKIDATVYGQVLVKESLTAGDPSENLPDHFEHYLTVYAENADIRVTAEGFASMAMLAGDVGGLRGFVQKQLNVHLLTDRYADEDFDVGSVMDKVITAMLAQHLDYAGVRDVMV